MKNKFHLSPLEILSKFSELNLPEQFCIVPFTNLILNPSGEVSVCRQKGTKHIVGNVNDNSIEDIWNSDYLKKWRQEFLSGDIEICKKEITNDACHLSSGSYFFIEKVEFDINQKDLPMKLTANFNGQCNLRCKMCDVWQLENGFYDKINYWSELEEKFFPYIKEIELLSGEPLIQKDTWRLIDSISRVNPDCVWSFTTNAHYELTSEMINNLNKIKIKNIIFSVDSFVDKRYENIRLGGKLSRVLKTMDQYKSFAKARKDEDEICFTVHFLFMKDNWDELLDILERCDHNEFMVTINTLLVPSSDSILSLSDDKKKNILNYYLNKSPVDALQRITRALVPVIKSLERIDEAKYFSLLKNKLVGTTSN